MPEKQLREDDQQTGLAAGERQAVAAMERFLDLSKMERAGGSADDSASPVLSTINPTDPARTCNLPAPPPGYEILGELGRGGMGVVYKAKDVRLKRTVAIKQLLIGGQASQEQRARFQAEAEAIARLQHPHIVQVFQAGEHDSQPFFVLEFVPGGSLDKQVAGRPQPVREAVQLVLLLARAVQAAHQAGVIHRDLKPANILLAPATHEPALNTPWGSPKITDFGLARLRNAEQNVSVSGMVMGTPCYMAPEQAEGRTRDIGPQTDVWALGVILYELLAGKLPFKADSLWRTIQQVCCEEPPPLNELRPEVPVSLVSAVRRCLQKQPEQRYPTVAALAEDLAGWLNEKVTAELAGPSKESASQPPVAERAAQQEERPGVGEDAMIPTDTPMPRVAAPSRLLVLGVGLGVVALVLAFGAWALWSKLKPTEVAEKRQESREPKVSPDAADKPLSGELVMRVWAPNRGVRGLRIGVDERAVPLREDDQLQAEVTLSEPAYAFLLMVDGKGEVTPFFPWNTERISVDSVAVAPPVRQVTKLRSPNLAEKGWDLDDTAGLDTFLLLARREPWPAERSLADVLGKIPPAPLRDPGEVVVRGWDKGETVETVSLDIKRGVKKDASVIDDQLVIVVGRLSREFELIRVVRFAHVPKDR